MQPVLTAAEMAELDRYTIERMGVEGKELMGRAAREVLRVSQLWFPDAKRPVIFAGAGNNGGDGVALAGFMLEAEQLPLIVICQPDITDPPRLSSDSSYYYDMAVKAGVEVRLLPDPAEAVEILSSAGGDLLIDSLFGTGLDRPLGDYYVKLLDLLRGTHLPVLAVDCPSGLNCTSGEVYEGTLPAVVTVTMGYPKRGFYYPAAVEYVGKVITADLGFASLAEAGVVPACLDWPDALWEPLRHRRRLDTHKGDYGKLLIVAGHASYPGAPRLAALGALYAGAGLVRLVVPEPLFTACSSDPSVMVEAHSTDGQGGFAARPDARLLEYLDWADALLIGPGLGDGEAPSELAGELLRRRDLPVLIDADGLRALWPGNGDTLVAELSAQRRAWPLLLTPHVGELARLAGVSTAEASARWFEVARETARRLQVLVLAKSCQCLVAEPEGNIVFPRCGHPALATGGTGDVLSGIAAALLARRHALEARQPAPPESSRASDSIVIAVSAVNIHAQAGRLGAKFWGENGLTPTELARLVPRAMLDLGAR